MYLRKHYSNTPHPRIEPKILGRTQLSNQGNTVNKWNKYIAQQNVSPLKVWSGL
jgi:hypothetical protein